MAAGACLTFYYFDTTSGGTPPAAPNKVSILVRVENLLSASNVIVYQNLAAEPSNGASYSFCATATGIVGGSPRAGTYRLLANLVKDDAVGDIGEYNINTDGDATVGSIVSSDQGALRGQAVISSIARSAYPSGSTFAYGASSDESVTITTTLTQPNGDVGVETAFNSVLDSATLLVGQAGTTTDLDATTLAQAFVIDSTFPAANSPYVGGFTIAGNSVLTGLKWTVLASSGHGATVVRVSDTFAYDSVTFNIDPGVKWDRLGMSSYADADNMLRTRITSSGGALATVFNRAETVYWEGYLVNARSALLSRAMTVAVEDSVPTTCQSLGSITPVAMKYSGTYAISTGATCLASNDAAGLPRFFKATNTDQSKTSLASFYVSTLYYVDYHPQKTSTLIMDDFPTQNAAEASTFVISADTMYIWCHVRGVRLDTNIDTGVNDVIMKETETDDVTVIDTFTIGTGSDGWTTASDTVNPAAPSRTIHGHCSVSFNGNTGSTIQSIGWSSAFTGNLICRFSTDEAGVTVGEPIRGFVSVERDGVPIAPDEVPTFQIDYADNTTNPATWANAIPVVNMTNVVDDTQTVNGALYYVDWTPVHRGINSILIKCTLVGTTIYADKFIRVLEDSMTQFESLTGFTGTEFLAVAALAVVGVILWSRSTDMGIRGFGAVLCMVGGLIFILMALAVGVGGLWLGAIGFGIILFTVGGYLLVRMFIDAFDEGKLARGEA